MAMATLHANPVDTSFSDHRGVSIIDCMVTGGTRLQQGDISGALKAYMDGQDQLEADHAMDSAEGAGIMWGIAGVRALQNDLEGAAAGYESALGILERTLTLESLEGLLVLTALGDIKQQQHKLREAEQVWTRARKIREEAQMLCTPDGVALLIKLGGVRRMQDDLHGAAAALLEARHFNEEMAKANCPATDTATLSGDLQSPSVNPGQFLTEVPKPGEGCFQEPNLSIEELEMMAVAYTEERQMMEATQTLETPRGAELMMNLGIVKRLQGDIEGAAAAYHEARQIDDAVSGVACTASLAASRPETPSKPGDAVHLSAHGVHMLRPRTSVGTTCDQAVLTDKLAAGSSVEAARMVHRLNAKLERMHDAHL